MREDKWIVENNHQGIMCGGGYVPGVGGMELQRILCARKCPIPVLFMTAYDNDAVRRRVLDAGAFCFLEKPFDGNTIVRHLQDALKSSPRPA